MYMYIIIFSLQEPPLQNGSSGDSLPFPKQVENEPSDSQSEAKEPTAPTVCIFRIDSG